MKSLKEYLIEGGREDLARRSEFDSLVEEWANVSGTERAALAKEVHDQHPELSVQECVARAGYRWLTMKYPQKQSTEVGGQKTGVIPKLRDLPRWAIITWGVLVLLILGVIAARSDPPRRTTRRGGRPVHFAFTVPNGIFLHSSSGGQVLYQIGGGPFVRVQDEGVTIKTWAAGMAVLNYTGGGITCTAAGNVVTCNVPTGGGGASWDAITNPVANQALSMGAFASSWTFGAATGAGVNLITVTDTLNNTGTGYIWNVNLASGSAAKPARLAVNGNGVEVNNSGLLTKLGTGGLDAAALLGVVPVANGGLNNNAAPSADGQIPIWNAAQSKYVPGDPIVSGPDAPGTAPTKNPVQIGGFDGTNVQRVKTDASGNVQVGVASALPAGSNNIGSVNVANSPTVTSNQGTAAALSGGWPVKVTDGTNTMPTMDAAARGGYQRITDGTDTLQLGSSTTTPTLILCDNSQAINAAASGNTQLVALTAGQSIYVCSYAIQVQGTNTAKLVYGTGTACGTGQSDLTGPLGGAAQAGASNGSGLGMILKTAAGNALCINNSAAVQIGGHVTYTKF